MFSLFFSQIFGQSASFFSIPILVLNMRTRKAYQDWVERHRGKGRGIKEIGGRYHLTSYEYKMVDGRRKKVSTGTLGTIRPEGLIPFYRKGQTIRMPVSAPLEYGASYLLEVLGKDVLSNLSEPFSSRFQIRHSR